MLHGLREAVAMDVGASERWIIRTARRFGVVDELPIHVGVTVPIGDKLANAPLQTA
jgi:hypothetical protein